MTFAQLDDRFDDHPKFIEYGMAEMGLISCGITYANRNLTDGVLPRAWPQRRFGPGATKVVGRLVRDGVWVQRDSGEYEIVGFLDHNPSRAEVEARRATKSESRREAGRLGGLRSGETRRSKNEANAKQNEAKDAAHRKQNEALSSPLLSDPISPCSPPKQSEPDPDPESHRVGLLEPRRERLPSNATDDGVGGFAVAAWCEGVRRATGKPFVLPRGSATIAIVEALLAHCPDPARREAFAQASAEQWVRSRPGRTLNPLNFVDWLNSPDAAQAGACRGGPEDLSNAERAVAERRAKAGGAP